MQVELNIVAGRGAPQLLALDAPSLDEACMQAKRRGYSVLDARVVDSGLSRLSFRAAGTRFEVAVFVEQLHDLLAAGLSVIEALDTLLKGRQDGSQSVLSALVDSLRDGERFSDALAAHPIFPALLVALVRSSELTSDLPQALERYMDHQRQAAELRHRVTSVAIYPTLVTLVGLGVLLFLMLYVMPRFARIFDGMSGELPWSARAMVAWSHWVNAHGMWVAIVIGGLVIATTSLLASPVTRVRAMQALLNSAPLRNRLRTYFLARWYRATGLLLEGGIPLPQALRLSAEVLPAEMQGSARAVERGVREGLSPTDAHVRAGMATPVAEQLMRAGERIGELGAVLTRAAKFHEAEFARSLERSMRVLEPVVMTLVGVGVGVVVVLMYLPIFELAAALQ